MYVWLSVCARVLVLYIYLKVMLHYIAFRSTSKGDKGTKG
jgi:hypothetical protein